MTDVEASVDVELLRRFHVALVASIERASPSYLQKPFTLAEIYQDLVPYRTHRDLIGVAMNGDYEHALMWLLAGAGHYLILESPHARDAILEELRGKNPNTGLFRDYAAATVRLNPAQLGKVPAPEPPPPEATLFDDLLDTAFVDPPELPGHDGPSIAALVFEPGAAQPPDVGARPEFRRGGSVDSDSPPSTGESTPSPASTATPSTSTPDADSLGPGRPPAFRAGWSKATEAPNAQGPPEIQQDQERSSQSSTEFWSERTPPEVEGLDASAPRRHPGAPQGRLVELEELEGENRRLKILLAERLLEIEDLRRRLRASSDADGA